MSALASVVATVVLGALAALQVLVALGRPLGRFVWGGQHRALPRHLRFGSAVSVVLYALMAVVLLSRAGVLPGGDRHLVRTGTWVLVGYFALGIVLNGISRSPSERVTMVPACAVLTVSSLAVALGAAPA